MFFSEMLDELQTTLPKSHLVYHGLGCARGCRNVCMACSPTGPLELLLKTVVHSLNLNNWTKNKESVSNDFLVRESPNTSEEFKRD